MKTTKPLTTISYNSEAFLNGTLNRLVTGGYVQFWAYIKHLPEDDETKAHFHLYLEPAKRIDSQAVAQMFLEPVFGIKEPLRVMPWRFNSQWADWYWYGLHDKRYLASKGEARKHHYSPDAVVANDKDYLREMVNTHPRPCSEMIRALDLYNEGIAPVQIALMLNVKLERLNYWLKGFNRLVGAKFTNRGGHAGHEELVTGEVMEVEGTNNFRELPKGQPKEEPKPDLEDFSWLLEDDEEVPHAKPYQPKKKED